MRFMNTDKRFGMMAIVLHWTMAILIIGLLAVGLYMVSLPLGLQKLKLYGWHKAFGLTVLCLAILRLSWRLSNKAPRLSLPVLEKLAARLVHWGLYGFMFAMPISGWLMTSAAGLAPSFFGLWTFPVLIAPSKTLLPVFQFVHHWLGYGLIAVILLHTAAALKHHFVDKDDILKRMIT